jgi:hypothetical protein
MTIATTLQSLSSGDEITVTIDGEPSQLTGTVTHVYHSSDTGYADGELTVDIDANPSDIPFEHALPSSVTISQSTDYSGNWNPPTVGGWNHITNDDGVVIEETHVSFGTVTEIL